MILFVRHAQSEGNAAGVLVGRSDPPLSRRGVRQAADLAPACRDVVAVWTSPLVRARATALAAAPQVAIHQTDDRLLELDYGSLDGQPVAALFDDRDTLSRLLIDPHHRYGDGESLHELDTRVHAFCEELFADTSLPINETDAHVLVVSHVSPIKSAVAWALGVPGLTAWRMSLDNATITTVGARRGRPWLVSYNAVPTPAREG